MTTPNAGVTETSFTLDGATNAFLSRWEDADKPSDTDEGETPNLEDDATVQAGDNESDELDLEDLEEDEDASSDSDDADASDHAPVAGDDHRVTITVDGEEKSVTVKDLKRLYGQEASLTRKSQEVAAARKAADADAERYMLSAQRLIDKAKERFAPFENIDWMVAQQKLTPDEFQVLRNEAREAATDLQFLNEETNGVLDQIRAQKQQEFAAAAQAAIATLERDVPGWSREVYDKVRSFAVEQGMEVEAVNNIVDPSAIKIIHSAMKYDELKRKAAQKKATAQKAGPKKVVKPSSGAPQKIGGVSRPNDKLKVLQKTGRRDDAVNAFLERWSDNGDD